MSLDHLGTNSSDINRVKVDAKTIWLNSKRSAFIRITEVHLKPLKLDKLYMKQSNIASHKLDH